MVDATLPASFYADFSGLTTLKKDVKGNDPQAIREAARQFESLFTDMMLKSMRAAKLGDGLGDSQQTDLYQDMYDQQLALQMSQGKGLGLADMLVQQLTRSGAIKAGAGAAAGAVHGSAQGNGAHGAVSHAARISFIRKLEPYAQRAAAQLGISSTSLIAQAALETGWGQHVPAGSGGSSHNLFGIKAGANWSGGSVNARTTEYLSGSGGAAMSVPQSFRAYSSLQQGVNDYVTLLQRSPGYQQALGTGDNVGAFASALQRGGYATDPDYVQKLVAMADT
ncbi:MAG: glucosaminidase domain-containing protein, partial [Steroidobacteraceae bacterium]